MSDALRVLLLDRFTGCCYQHMTRNKQGIGLASVEGRSAYHIIIRFSVGSFFLREGGRRQTLRGNERRCVCQLQCHRSYACYYYRKQYGLACQLEVGVGSPNRAPLPSLPCIDCCVPLACRLSSALMSSTPLAYSSSWSMYICCLLQVSSRRAT